MDYGSEEYRESRDKEIHEWLESKVETIDAIPDNYLQAICYFSLLECFVQEYGNYPTNNVAKTFCDFVLTFQRSYAFLNMIDPVTLFYHFQAQLSSRFDLSFVDSSGCYTPDHAIKDGNAKQMIEELRLLGVREDAIIKHKYVRLLYSLRSKLSHELSPPGGVMWSKHHFLEKYPYYISCGRSIILDSTIIRNEVWELTMPVGFIKSLVIECINNYLDFSLKHKNDPFENNEPTRKSRLAWYD